MSNSDDEDLYPCHECRKRDHKYPAVVKFSLRLHRDHIAINVLRSNRISTRANIYKNSLKRSRTR